MRQKVGKMLSDEMEEFGGKRQDGSEGVGWRPRSREEEYACEGDQAEGHILNDVLSSRVFEQMLADRFMRPISGKLRAVFILRVDRDFLATLVLLYDRVELCEPSFGTEELFIAERELLDAISAASKDVENQTLDRVKQWVIILDFGIETKETTFEQTPW